jgi:hypothetical protein
MRHRICPNFAPVGHDQNTIDPRPTLGLKNYPCETDASTRGSHGVESLEMNFFDIGSPKCRRL